MIYLNRPVPFTGDLQGDPFSAWVQHNLALLDRHNSTWHLLRIVLCRIYQREGLLGGDRQETTIKGLLKIAII
jgi:hypothetical protein